MTAVICTTRTHLHPCLTWVATDSVYSLPWCY